MKLIRWGEKGNEKPGIVLDGKYFDVGHFGEDFTGDFFATAGLKKLEKQTCAPT